MKREGDAARGEMGAAEGADSGSAKRWKSKQRDWGARQVCDRGWGRLGVIQSRQKWEPQNETSIH